MTSSLQSVLCCWASQQTPPSSPKLPSAPSEPSPQCTCDPTSTEHGEKTFSTETSDQHPQHSSRIQEKQVRDPAEFDEKASESGLALAASGDARDTQPSRIPVTTPAMSAPAVDPPRPFAHASSHSHSRTSTSSAVSVASTKSSRSSYLKAFMFMKKAPSEPESPTVSPITSTSQPLHSLGKPTSSRFSLQKYYYPRNSMSASSIDPSAPSSPTSTTRGSFSRIDNGNSGPLPPASFAGPRTLGLIPSQAAASTTATATQQSKTTTASFQGPTSTPPRSGTPISISTTPRLMPLAPPLISRPLAPDPVVAGSSTNDSSMTNTTSPPVIPTPPLSIPSQMRVPTPVLSKAPLPVSQMASPPSLPSLFISMSPPPVSVPAPSISLSTISSSYTSSSASSMISASSTPNTTPSSSPTETSSSHLLISSPRVSELTPFPASALSPAKLASLIERVQYQKKGMGPSGSKPLILDLRMNSDADPMTIVYSININLPTLLMRRYRRGGAVTSFALESFITIPSDKDLYHLIQDEWRQEQEQSSEPIVHDVVVLDQDMRSGKEEYGRSASSAWTLVSVLERGGGNCGGPIRLWYLDGGFDSFQAWDASGKYLARLGSDIGIDSEIPEQGEPPKLDLLDMPVVRRQEDDAVHPFSAPLTLPSQSTANGTLSNTIPLDDKTTQAIDHAVSLTNASLGGTPRRSAPARRESLFSLNTKSLQRPPGLSRAQTIGVSAINVKPLSVPTLNTSTSLQPLHEGGGNGVAPPLPPLRHKESWLTVPGAPVVSSPAQSLASMSLGNNSMEIANSASTDYTGSQWSVHGGHGGFTYGDNNISPDQQHHGAGAVGLSGRKSFSSTTTLNSMHYSGVASGIQEEDEGHPTSLGRGRSDSGLNGTFFNNPSYLRRHHSSGAAGQMPPPTPTFGEGFQQQFMEAGPFGSSNHGGFSPEYSYPRMFQDGINSNYNSGAVAYGNGQVGGYDDALMEEGADEGEQEISCILPNFLYLGPEIVTKEQVQELERLGVKRVLNMARECEDALVANEPGWEYHKIGVQDYVEADVSAGLLQAVDIIASSPESAIYVHCKAGKSRSVTATIAYLITHLHWSLNKAYNHVLAQRPCMCPNIGFVTELMRMEEKILGTERAGGLVRAGSLNSIMSLSTASMTGQGEGNDKHQRHHHHLSLQHHHSPSLSVGTMASATAATSPTLVKSGGLTAKSSMSSLVMLTASSSPPPPTPHPLQPF